jgi:adenylate kinase
MLNIVLFGPPGAGKGTEYSFAQYNLVHRSTGDLLRLNCPGTGLGMGKTHG